MVDKRSLAREGEPSQIIEKGLELPIPEQDEFFVVLKKAPGEKPS